MIERSEPDVSSKIFESISSPTRLKVLKLLYAHESLSYTKLMELLDLSPSKDAGRFGYHLRTLLRTNLVEQNRDKHYVLTDLGRRVVSFSSDMEEFLSRRSRKMIVRSSRMAIEEFDRSKIARSLVEEANVPAELATRVAEEVEEKLLDLRVEYLTAPLIREFVNAVLIEKGLEEYRHKLTRLGMPVRDVSREIEKARLTSDITYQMAERILEEHTLLAILPRDIADAHLDGYIHLCDIGDWALRPSEVQLDLRPFLRSGFKLPQLTFLASAGPPTTFDGALSLMTSAVRASMLEVSRGVAIDNVNVFLAPFIQDIPLEEVRRALSRFIFELAQIALGKCLTLGLQPTMPEHLAKEMAIGPNGHVIGNYGDFVEEALALFECFADVMFEDHSRKPIVSPRVVVKVDRESFRGGAERVLLKVHELAARYGTPYFASRFETWQAKASYFSSGIRLGSDWTKDWELDTLRTGSLGIVFINLPRIAYEARGNTDSFYKKVEKYFSKAKRALDLKHHALQERVKRHALPLLSKLIHDEAYFRLGASTRLIGMMGLNEAAKAHVGTHMYEDKRSFNFSSEVVRFLSGLAREASRKPSVRVAACQAPYLNPAYRLAKLDVEKFGRARTCTVGPRERPRYTATTTFSSEEFEMENVEMEGMLHRSLNGGHMLTISLDREHSPEELLVRTKVICEKTNVGFLTYDRKFSYCDRCNKVINIKELKCPICKSSSLVRYNRHKLFN